MTTLKQTHLAAEALDADVTIGADARAIKPALRMLQVLGDEARWEFDTDGLHVDLTDAANVAQVTLDVYPAAFKTYECDTETTVGMPHDSLWTAMNLARYGKSQSDDVRLSLQDQHVNVTVDREYDHADISHRETVSMIDPDSVRESDLVDLDGLPWRAQTDVDAFKDVIDHAKGRYGHIEVSERDGQFVLGGEEDIRMASTEMGAATGDGEPGAASIFSLDYQQDIARGLKAGLVETVTVEWGEEFPGFWNFERENSDDETMYEGWYTMAPRIQQ